MKKKRRIVLVMILLLTVGFAAVSTNLIINITSLIGTNTDDFDVYFSSAIIDSEDYTNEVISDDKLSINYSTKVLSFKDDNSVLEYEVTNASKNYDAEVSVTCTGETEEVTIKHTPEIQIVPATEIKSGTVDVILNKTVTEEQTIEFTCTLNVKALERESLGENDVSSSSTYALIGTFADEDGVAISNANLVIYSETPHYVTTDAAGNIYYDGLERGSHEIYYVDDTLENIKLMSKEEVKMQAKTYGTFVTNEEGEIILNDSTKIMIKDIVKSKYFCDALLEKSFEYDYIGSEQQFISLCDGTYQIELWGASGGSRKDAANPDGNLYFDGYGKGGYVSGNIEILKNNVFYVYVGERGVSGEYGDGNGTAGTGGSATFNGGGAGGIGGAGNSTYPGTRYSGGPSGGGATDIRLVNGPWNNFESLKSRIMVAGAGGGYDYDDPDYAASLSTPYTVIKGGNNLGLTGESGATIGTYGTKNYTNNRGVGTTQTTGFSFGIGGAGDATGGGTNGEPICNGHSGGGGGYYGGSGGKKTINDCFVIGGGAGSSFISGYTGSNAISASSTSSNIIHTGSSIHYSGKTFTNASMIGGKASMPTIDGTSTMIGNSGNGYAKITLISLN